MSKVHGDELLVKLEALADLAEHDGNPLQEPLRQALQLCREQQHRIERMLRIADGFNAAALGHSTSALRRQRSRLEKVARIADRYQELMHEQNLHLTQASSVDPLTGLANRRQIDSVLGDELARAHRRGQALCVAMLDVDHFKHINDGFGHAVGDRALTSLAQVLKASLREQDFCGRWGGEEFVLVLPGSTTAGARTTLERVLSAIRQLEVDTGQGLVRMTASAGLAQRLPAEAAQDLVRRADIALLMAKRNGRDRIELAPEAASAGGA
ncbi:diguanylate cyclase [Inhella sp.]|uniref:diguanylate cyclase n=1 Tax=Inhella sp. TaxID=1921806 RepID=UPI0035B18D02